MLPTPANAVPIGPDWLHDEARWFPRSDPLTEIPARSAIIDCELVGCDESGLPCFRTLMELGNRAPAVCLWCFDLLYLDGVRITPMSLTQRTAILNDVVNLADNERLQFSGEFNDPERLLAAGEKTGLEGIVSKRLEAARVRLSLRPHKGLAPGQDDFLVAKGDRWELFQKGRA
jgi:bifunctional non-homologous end joining protein LigD